MNDWEPKRGDWVRIDCPNHFNHGHYGKIINVAYRKGLLPEYAVQFNEESVKYFLPNDIAYIA